MPREHILACSERPGTVVKLVMGPGTSLVSVFRRYYHGVTVDGECDAGSCIEPEFDGSPPVGQTFTVAI